MRPSKWPILKCPSLAGFHCPLTLLSCQSCLSYQKLPRSGVKRRETFRNYPGNQRLACVAGPDLPKKAPAAILGLGCAVSPIPSCQRTKRSRAYHGFEYTTNNWEGNPIYFSWRGEAPAEPWQLRWNLAPPCYKPGINAARERSHQPSARIPPV
jgi:hypothetical protein